MKIRAMEAFGVVTATVLLAIGYFGSASAQQEDLQGPAEYVVQHWGNGDVIALPDHAITSVIRYYLTNDEPSYGFGRSSGFVNDSSKDWISRCTRPGLFPAEYGS